MERLLINCDLGENETEAQTERLLRLVDAASICCGVHAGGVDKTRATVEMAVALGVQIGAHPGLADCGGRGAVLPTLQEFSLLLDEQIDSFLRITDLAGASLSYVKLHGSLYHAVERDEDLAHTYLKKIQSLGPSLGIFALAGGSVACACVPFGIPVLQEAFLDRTYMPDGTLMPRAHEKAILSQDEALARFTEISKSGVIEDCHGKRLKLRADTLCVHGDSPESETLLARIRDLYSP